jgi:hypothetical protein
LQFIGGEIIHMSAFFVRCKRTTFVDILLQFQGYFWSKRLEKAENLPSHGSSERQKAKISEIGGPA